jgi:alkylation response protein AidB-like acyl-CoA dehydrogenase
MDRSLSPALQALLATHRNRRRRGRASGEVDRSGEWPAHSMQAFARAGLTGLQVPLRLGGHGQGLQALAMMTEIIARACPSSALCFGMHSVGTAVIAAKATPFQEEHYLRPIAQGRHLTTLALSESGSGAHFYLPETELAARGSEYLVNGTKQFVTNGAMVDSYVVSTRASSWRGGDFRLRSSTRPRQHEWLAPWSGLYAPSRAAPERRAGASGQPAGEDGDQVWYVFEVVAPYFQMAMAGTYLGVAQSALDAADEHLRHRRYAHSGAALRDIESMQTRYAGMWVALEKTRALIGQAAVRGDGATRTRCRSCSPARPMRGTPRCSWPTTR